MLEWQKRLGFRLTLRDLHILRSVVEAGSMAKAARWLGMSQPSVSQAISTLEAALRVRLLDRHPTGVEPTDHAVPLLNRSRVIFDELEQSVRDLQFMTDPSTGEVRLGCPENLALGFVPTIIEHISRQHSKLRFTVIPVEPVAMGFRELRDRTVDIMIGRIIRGVVADDLQAEVLFEDRYVVVAGKNSKWARRSRIELGELANEPWILTPSSNPIHADIAAGFAKQGFELPPAAVSTYSMHVRNHLLATGRFLSILFESALQYGTFGSQVKVLPVKFGMGPRPVAVFKLRGRSVTPAVDLFVNAAQKVAKRLHATTTRRRENGR